MASDLRKRSVLTLEEMGIPVEHAQHEDAPSQHEIDLRYTDALTMADTVMTVRLVVKETAQRQGVHASFMPKPLTGVQGSGMHTHLSLFEGDTNAFYDAEDPFGMSEVAKRFTAGLLRHAHEITAVTNQWVNSYKRLVVGYEAPIHVSWARNNRSALIRVPVIKRNKHESTRIEYRAPDTACNPYLAFAVILAAGLKGVEEGYELPREAATNLFAMTPEELAADGIRPLPGSLNEAVAEMEHSELVAEALGEHVFEWFIRNKRAEWARLQDPHQPVRARPLLPAPLGARAALDGAVHNGTRQLMEPLLCYPEPFPDRARPRHRTGRLPLEGHRPPRARRDRRARRRLGRGGGVRRARRHRGVRPVPAGAGP